MKHFQAKNSEALTVLIRWAACCGETVKRVTPVNDQFVVSVTGKVEMNDELNLQPFANGLNRDRVYWSEIVEIHSSALEFLGIEL